MEDDINLTSCITTASEVQSNSCLLIHVLTRRVGVNVNTLANISFL